MMELRVNGKRVFGTTGGQTFDRVQPALIFVHGAGMDHTVWSLQTRWFAWRGRSVFAVDLPGHGRSEGPPLATIEEQAAWLLELVEAAGNPSITLIGHSMGALASLAAASRPNATKISALALLGIGAEMPVHPDLLHAARDNEATARDFIMSWGFGLPAHFGANPAPGLWMQGGGRSLLSRAKTGVLHIDLAACDAYKTARDAAQGTRCPVLFIVGGSDRMTPPSAAAELAQQVTGSRTVTIANAGHMMMVEKPDETLDALISLS